VVPPGQDGNQVSFHYDSLLLRWADGDYLPMKYGTPLDGQGFDLLQLQPA